MNGGDLRNCGMVAMLETDVSPLGLLPTRDAIAVLVVGIIGAVLYILHHNGRKRARELEEQLRIGETLNRKLTASDLRFQSFLANSSEHLWCVEFDEPIPLDLPEEEQIELILDRGRYVEVNDAFAEAYGATVKEATGWPLEKTLPRSVPETVEFLREVVGCRFRMTEAETVEQCKDGSKIVTLNNFAPTIEHGKVVRVWGTARDVTARRTAEWELEHAAEFNRVVLDSMDSHIVILDRTGMITNMNVAWEDFSHENEGMPSNTCVGVNYLETCRRAASSGDSIAQLALDGLRSMLEGTSEFFELEYPCHSPTKPGWFLLRAKPLKTPDGGLVVSHVDITRVRLTEIELAQQRDQLSHLSRVATMGEFTAAFAHELSQPLAATLRNAEAARRFLQNEKPDIEEVRAILDDIIRDDLRAAKVLEGIRNHMRKDSGQRVRLDLNEVISDTVKLLPSAVLSRQPIELVLEDGLPSVMGDAVQLQQVVFNLVNNASEAMSGAKIEAGASDITIMSQAGPDGNVTVEVADRGQGMTEENLEAVFTPFFTTKKAGLGMGLAIDKTIVEAHDGRIRAENRADGGAKFSFSLPVIPENAS